MSGGHFGYEQFSLQGLERMLAEVDLTQETPEEAEVLAANINTAIRHLQLAFVHVHRLDWLLSCDDGFESYQKRLAQELEAIK